MNKTALLITINDEEVYDNLIVPYKSNRELTSLVTRLLTTYYYNEEMRGIVDNDGMFNTESIADSYNEYFKDINAILAIQGSMQDSMEDTLKTGLTDIVNSAEVRKDIDPDVWGEPIPRVSARIKETVDNLQTENTEEVVKDVSNTANRLDKIEKTLEKVVSLLSNEEITELLKTKNNEPNLNEPTADIQEKVFKIEEEEIQTPSLKSEDILESDTEVVIEIKETQKEEEKSLVSEVVSEGKDTLSGKDRLRQLVASLD